MSKRVKVLRALLADAQKAKLYVVAIPTEMTLAETHDLYSACQRVPIHVAAIFLNQVRPAGACALCAELTAKETTVRRRFEQRLPDVSQTAVYRYEPPRGLDRLRALGQALYKRPCAFRWRRRRDG
jgi:anion-transporting  ArsA/GET3 family ATPase